MTIILVIGVIVAALMIYRKQQDRPNLFRLAVVGFLKREYNLEEAYFADVLEEEIVQGSFSRTTPQIWSTSFLINCGERFGIKTDDLQSKLEFYVSEHRRQVRRKVLFYTLAIIGFISVFLIQWRL